MDPVTAIVGRFQIGIFSARLYLGFLSKIEDELDLTSEIRRGIEVFFEFP